eukprot:2602599-Lingulodinium_polyedra.AAC.1
MPPFLGLLGREGASGVNNAPPPPPRGGGWPLLGRGPGQSRGRLPAWPEGRRLTRRPRFAPV